MGTPPSDEVTEVARRRLQALRLELTQRAPMDDSVDFEEPPPDLPDPGRHARTTVTVGGRVTAWCGERMPATLRGRVRLGAREVLVLVGLLGVALAVAGCLALRSGAGEPVRTAAPAGTASADGPVGALATPAPDVAGASASPTGEVVVDVAGKVRRPGVVTLPAGSRVVDAVRKAGGTKGRVDLSGLNLARVLTDGEQVLVGTAPAGGAAAGAAASPGAPPAGGLLSLNTATLEQLDGLPGVGPVTAQKILSWREAHGAFTSVDELLEVDGIGEKTLADLAPLLTL